MAASSGLPSRHMTAGSFHQVSTLITLAALATGPPSILDLTVGSSLFLVFREILRQEGVDKHEGNSVSSTRDCLKIHPLLLCLARDHCQPLPQQGWPCDGTPRELELLPSL